MFKKPSKYPENHEGPSKRRRGFDSAFSRVGSFGLKISADEKVRAGAIFCSDSRSSSFNLFSDTFSIYYPEIYINILRPKLGCNLRVSCQHLLFVCLVCLVCLFVCFVCLKELVFFLKMPWFSLYPNIQIFEVEDGVAMPHRTLTQG